MIMEMFKRLQALVTELQSTNSNNAKVDILKKYPDCKPLLLYTFDPFKQYGITSKNLKKKKAVKVAFTKYADFFILLDDLRNGKLTGHLAITTVNDYCNDNKEYEKLIHSIIDKDLRCRMGVKAINKSFPGTIPTFEVALAEKYADYKDKIDFKKGTWYASRKLDGVRCIVIKNGRTVSFFSRTGKPFHTLGSLAGALLDHPAHSFVLDGELCIMNSNGIEDFKAIVSTVRKKDYTIKNPKYKVFDILSIDDFLKEKSEKDLTYRLMELAAFVHSCGTDMIDKLDQDIVTGAEEIEALKLAAVERGWEGYILRKDTVYEGKRTKDMLKVKTFFDEEFVVESIETNIMRVTVEDEEGNTKEVEENLMAKAFIRYKGFEVGVGSGWDLEERRKYYANPEELIGKVITVQHFGESSNDHGGLSLRFPTVKYNYGKERDL
jgi:DNA ligase-1